MNRHSMGNSRGGRLFGRLSQLTHFLQNSSFFCKKGFSSFSIIFLGVTGSFSALPNIDTKELIALDTDTVEAPLPLNQDELCRWQRDFTFFNDLVSEKKSLPEEAPCALDSATGTFTLSSNQAHTDEKLSGLIRVMTAGFPIEIMAPVIAEYDREVAALIVGIAKKESNWGKRVPLDKDGADCFNYWGWKGAGARGVAMGHGCFGTPEEAVRAVGNRITELVEKRKTSEPKSMIVWKCGSSCATHSPESVRKWISDVDLYYRKIVQN